MTAYLTIDLSCQSRSANGEASPASGREECRADGHASRPDMVEKAPRAGTAVNAPASREMVHVFLEIGSEQEARAPAFELGSQPILKAE